jgi:AcrR family transcriptional regulator
MVRTNVPDARGRILQAALQVFAEKSYEGSRIDEIARLANVPKSLIYYHFKSKEEILKQLSGQFIKGYKALLTVSAEDTHQSKADEMKNRLQNRYYEFAMANADLIRIIFIESLRKDNESPVIFQVAEAIVDAGEEAPLAGTAGYDRNERLIAEFFTGVVPLFAYLCFSGSWLKTFDMGREYFDKTFMDVLSKAHGSYHREHE